QPPRYCHGAQHRDHHRDPAEILDRVSASDLAAHSDADVPPNRMPASACQQTAGERGLHLIDIEPAGDSSLGYLVNSIGLADPTACDHASHPKGNPVKGFVAATSRRATEFIRNAAQGLAR